MKSNLFNKSKGIQFILTWIVLFFASILVRLPHILSDNFWFDGDEAIIGIMAQRLIAFEEFPIYFAGQNYGFSTFEVFSTAIFELFLGSGALTLFLGGILLFSLACTFIFIALKRKEVNTFLLYGVIFLLITFPTWHFFAGKVRGGYLTAFLGISILFYYFSKTTLKRSDFIVAGLWLGIIFESHVFILIGFSPIIITEIIKRKFSIKDIFITIASILVTVLLIRLLGTTENPVWNPPKFSFDNNPINIFSDEFSTIFRAGFSGLYYYGMAIDFPNYWKVLSDFLLILMFVFIIKKSINIGKIGIIFLSSAILVSILYLSVFSILGKPEPRYFLGFFTGILFWFIYLIPHLKGKIESFLLISSLIISLFGITNAPKYIYCWYLTEENEQKLFSEFHQAVVDSNAEAIFLAEALLQWKWNYLYGAEIPGSSFYERERIPFYQEQVKALSISHPEKVVIGGFYGVTMGTELVQGFNDGVIRINSKYFIQPAFRIEYKERAERFISGN
ncbi:MAG: hypothetical protein WC994_01175 [Brumimicrobium sp.]